MCGCMAVKNYPKKEGKEEEGGGDMNGERERVGRRGGGRREEGEGIKHGGWTNRDREMYTCACVFFLCVYVQGYVHVDV